ncbi:xylulokinase [Herbidospora daliensis]|uniref:xylulokinase n=1 Tax=Herbidospora daliensis TaxID=295585 RepID=UPI000A43A7FF|nr:FGGY family carbohydrate kinase [Herbidospora daliensis]
MHVLAIDQGSSGAKAAVVDGEGRIVAMTSRRTPVDHPETTAVQADPEMWWRALVSCVSRLPVHDVRAVAVSGFMHTVVPVTDEGKVLGPALLWPDQRPAGPSAADRVAWWAGHDPLAALARWYLPVKDFLRMRLTGEVATDRYEASGTGFLRDGAWSPAVATDAGVSVDRLPPIGEPLDIAGSVTREAAAATGLPEGTPVVMGTGDWMATLLGAGAVLPRRACVYLGTAGAVGGFASAEAARTLTEPLCFAAATSTGSALDWIAELTGRGAPDAVAAAESVPPGSRGVVFLPHLMGERGQGHDPSARGSVHGLTLAHGAGDLARAVIEGTAFWLRAIAGAALDGRDPAELVAVGGGARGDLWLRVIAAVLKRDLTVPETTEAGLLGTAMLAHRALTGQATHERWTRVARTVPADPNLANVYEPLFEEFLHLEERHR